jgi:hypothetical protein
VAGLEDLRRAALALPEVEETPWYAEFTWSARRRGFAYSWKGGALIRLGRERLQFLLEVRPDVFRRFALPGGNWAEVDISSLDVGELADLVREAWSGVVPKKLSRSA